MPDPRTQTLITSSLTTAAPKAIAAQAALGTLGSTFLGFAFAPVALGLAAQFNRVRFPRLPPIPQILGATNRLRARGLTPRLSSSPFTGNVVVSTQDQAALLPQLVREAETRAFIAPIANELAGEFFAEREALIESRRRASAGLSFDPSLRGGVRRQTATSPLEFVEGNFLNART